jgi:hypothetical protein
MVCLGALVGAAHAGADQFVSYEAGESAASEIAVALRNTPLKEAAEKVAELGAVEVRVAQGLANDRISLVSGDGLSGAALVPVFSSVLLSLGYEVDTDDGAIVVTKPAAVAAGDSVDIEVDVAAIGEEFSGFEGNLLTVLMPTMATDDDGKVIGLTGRLGQLPVSERLGLKDGDILHKLDGTLIDNLMVVMQMAEKFEGDSFTAVIIRDGEPITINYTLKQ